MHNAKPSYLLFVFEASDIIYHCEVLLHPLEQHNDRSVALRGHTHSFPVMHFPPPGTVPADGTTSKEMLILTLYTDEETEA